MEPKPITEKVKEYWDKRVPFYIQTIVGRIDFVQAGDTGWRVIFTQKMALIQTVLTVDELHFTYALDLDPGLAPYQRLVFGHQGVTVGHIGLYYGDVNAIKEIELEEDE